jgi:type IV pilus assembly protein PilC
MPNHHYKAVDTAGRIVSGEQLAADERALERSLAESGLSLISCEATHGPRGRVRRRPVRPRILMEFYYRLGRTLETGLPILKALDENSHELPSRTMRQVAGELRAMVESGNSLHEAMAAHGQIFSKLDRSIIRIGETTGALPGCLDQLASYLQWKEDLRHHVRKATIYPLFVVLALAGVIGVWLGYVLPKMVRLLQDMNATIPAPTRALLAISEFTQRYAWTLLVVGPLLVSLVLAFRRTPSGRLLWDRAVLRIPLLGRVLHNIALTRFGRNMATMLTAGIPLRQTLQSLIDNGLGNRFLETRLGMALAAIENGESIAGALKLAGGFPSLLTGAIRNGEATGTLDKAVQRLADYYDAEVKRTVQLVLAVVEPAAVVTLGAVFGSIILSILLPLYDVIGSMGKSY